MPRKKSIGQGIRELRKLRGYSLDTLGDAIDMEKIQLQAIETGKNKNPTDKTLSRIVYQLQYKMSDFYAYIGD